MNPPENVAADELLRLFDGELSDADARLVRSRLSASDQDTLAAWQHQKDLLRAMGQSIASEPIPPDMLHAAGQTGSAHANLQRWQRWGGMAAGVVLAFGLGWLTRGVGLADPGLQLAANPVHATQNAGRFQGQAALAHVTFTPEIKHPVEVTAEQQAHLVQWLSKRLGRELQVPKLSAQGYELMGGRLLPGDDGARAQFMFQRADGLRLTLYVGAVNETAAPASAQDTSFAFNQQANLASFYWVDRGFGYALSAALPKAELLNLAQAVYHLL